MLWIVILSDVNWLGKWGGVSRALVKYSLHDGVALGRCLVVVVVVCWCNVVDMVS